MNNRGRLIGLLVLMQSLIAWAGQTYYGASGYVFVPDGFVRHQERFGGYFSGEFAALERMRLYPKFLGFRWTNASQRLEISLASVSAFVLPEEGFKPRKWGDGLLPVIPGVKWNVDDRTSGRMRWAFAVGAMFPYGVYSATTVRFVFPFAQPEITAVMASTARSSSHMMAGGRLQFADASGKSLPVALTGEVGWASAMDSIGETAEAFYAFGLEFQMGRNLVLTSQFRRDPQTYYKDSDWNVPLAHQNTGGRWALKLEYHFSGVKQVLETRSEGDADE